jgi:DNA-binding IclR family transcriptional regulator
MHQENMKNPDQSESEFPQRHSRAGVQSLDIALRILRVLVTADRPLSLKEFSAQCKMSPSKLHRYLHSYVAAEMIAQTRRAGEYELGKLALEIGLAAVQRIDLVNNAADRLAELVYETAVPASLSVWSAQGPTVIRWQRGAQAINTAFSIGSMLPLLSSATGNVFLAYLPLTVTTPIIMKEITVPLTEVTNSIEEVTTLVRRQGYAIWRGAFIPGLTGISSPILNQPQEIMAAVTILTRTDQATEQSLIDRLLTFTASCSIRRT